MFFVTIPHSGRQIPKEAVWLKNLPPSILYCDIDAFVDELYEPALKKLKITSLAFPWHRYAVDANRKPEDICYQTVEGAKSECRKMDIIGFHWKETTKGDILISKPLSQDIHKTIVKKYYEPFHQKIRNQFLEFKNKKFSSIYHLDLHSMPSLGKDIHKDPGGTRAEVVIGNRKGASAGEEFTKLVFDAYKDEGFKVKMNWPYQGGRITEIYGQPKQNQHTIQVELNRSLYMNEEKGQKKENFFDLQQKFTNVLSSLQASLKKVHE